MHLTRATLDDFALEVKYMLAHLVDAVGELRENFIRDVMGYVRIVVREVQLLISLADPPLRLGQIAPPLCIRLLLQMIVHVQL